MPVGVGDHGIEGQRLRPPEARVVNSLESANLDVVLEAAAFVVDREAMRLKAFNPMNQSCGFVIDVAVEELDQHTRTSVARGGG